MAGISRRALLALSLGAGVAVLRGARDASASSQRASFSPGRSRQVATAQAPGRSTQQLDVGGVPRTYLRYEPAGLDAAAPVSLVLLLHGRGGNAVAAERAYGMSQVADQHQFVLVYPEAVGTPRAWNAAQVAERSDDVAFIRAVVERERGIRPIDAGQVFVCGHSSGAAMTYCLAGVASDLFSAVGVVAGPVGYRTPDGTIVTIPHPDRPVSVIHIHGTEDQEIPYRGGREPTNGTDLLSVADSIAFWVEQDGCDSTPTTEIIGAARRETYTGGRDGSEVTLWTIEGGGHDWPKPDTPISPAGATAGISATELIWAFFAAHGRAASHS